jgi:hypothetical protein
MTPVESHHSYRSPLDSNQRISANSRIKGVFKPDLVSHQFSIDRTIRFLIPDPHLVYSSENKCNSKDEKLVLQVRDCFQLTEVAAVVGQLAGFAPAYFFESAWDRNSE